MSTANRVRQDRPRLATVGDIDLCYDAFGDPERSTMLLIMGLGFQLIHWPEDFCRQLAAEGFRVVRFDNRDAGRSTHLPGRRYTLEDMAADAVGLLNALGVESAHVVGASLGGLQALEQLLHGLPAAFICPLVIVQHRRADADSRLLELLRHHCALPVIEPEDKAPIERGNVYLSAADYHLLVERGAFSLSVDPPVSYARPSIDVLFESAADAYGAATVGVVLTGANEDGARGAWAIKKAGGHVIVQDPNSAESPIAPRAVLDKTAVDDVLHMNRIAKRIVALCTSI